MSATLPTDPIGEWMLVACAVIGKAEIADLILESIQPGTFHHAGPQEAWLVIKGLRSDGKETTEIEFRRAWTATHKHVPIPEDFATALDGLPGPGHWRDYLNTLHDLKVRRGRILAHQQAIQGFEDTTRPVGSVEAEFQTATLEAPTSTGVLLDGREASSALIDDLETRFELHHSGKRTGIETGLVAFDRPLNGLQRGELTIIGARPSQGKTALALTIVSRACLLDQVPTLFITAEMSPNALNRRLCSMVTGIPSNSLRCGSLTEQDFKRLPAFRATLSKAPIHYRDATSGISASEVAATVRTAQRKHGIQLVVIDYLQKVRASGRKHEKRTYEVGEVSTELKAIAVRNGVAMLSLAQLSRADPRAKEKLPLMSSLADSTQIERDADSIFLLHRDVVKDGGSNATLILSKNRDGEIGVERLRFNGSLCRFENDL